MYFKIFVSVVLLSMIQSMALDCTYEASDGIHYDLSPLMNDDEDYIIHDYLGATGGNNTFVFNVCRNVVEIPRDSTGGKGCEKTVHDQDEEGHDIMDDSIVPAFLVSKSDATCNRVSSSIEKGNVDFKLYDTKDKSAGVYLMYSEGDMVMSKYFHYGLMLAFRCSTNSVIGNIADVERYGITRYIIWLDSIYACPTECYPENGKICSGHGICMYDESISASRCFCNTNNKGVKCEKSTGLSMTNIFMILDIAAVLVVVFTIAYLGCKLRKIRLDPDANVSLDTKFNELGSLAYTV